MSHDLTLQATPWHIINPTHIPVAATANLGDAIQSAAARKLWPTTKLVHRDKPRSWPKDAIVPLVGWYGHHRQPFPASANVVIVGFHCNPKSARCLKNRAEWFKSQVRNQGFPAFCRDIYTRDLLRSVGVDAEFGGCVTLTLPPHTGPRSGSIVIDVAGADPRELSTHEIVALSNIRAEQRLIEANKQIAQLGSALTVRTSRLHAWLPSLAAGTNASLIFPPAAGDVRFTGYNINAKTRQELFSQTSRAEPHRYRLIEGWFDFADVYRDIADRLPTGGTFVELGVYAGKSLSFMVDYLAYLGKEARVLGVDLFDRVAKPKVESALGDGAELLQADSAAAAAAFADGSVDAVFVDANHSADAVAADIRAWLPKLSATGVIAGHDLSPGHPGVRRGLLRAGIPYEPVSAACWIHDRRQSEVD
jgi:hypothetical protein